MTTGLKPNQNWCKLVESGHKSIEDQQCTHIPAIKLLGVKRLLTESCPYFCKLWLSRTEIKWLKATFCSILMHGPQNLTGDVKIYSGTFFLKPWWASSFVSSQSAARNLHQYSQFHLINKRRLMLKEHFLCCYITLLILGAAPIKWNRGMKSQIIGDRFE